MGKANTILAFNIKEIFVHVYFKFLSQTSSFRSVTHSETQSETLLSSVMMRLIKLKYDQFLNIKLNL